MIKKASLVSVGFAGQNLKDNYCIWLLFTLAIGILIGLKFYTELATLGQINKSNVFKQNYENITDINEINSKNQYLRYENAAEIYESVVTHGPLDIEFMMG